MKKLEELAEIKSNAELVIGDILVSRSGKNIVKISENNISEYSEKKTYFVVRSSEVEKIFESLKSDVFATWVMEHAKGTVMPLITIKDLKEFTINL